MTCVCKLIFLKISYLPILITDQKEQGGHGAQGYVPTKYLELLVLSFKLFPPNILGLIKIAPTQYLMHSHDSAVINQLQNRDTILVNLFQKVNCV